MHEARQDGWSLRRLIDAHVVALGGVDERTGRVNRLLALYRYVALHKPRVLRKGTGLPGCHGASQCQTVGLGSPRAGALSATATRRHLKSCVPWSPFSTAGRRRPRPPLPQGSSTSVSRLRPIIDTGVLLTASLGLRRVRRCSELPHQLRWAGRSCLDGGPLASQRGIPGSVPHRQDTRPSPLAAGNVRRILVSKSRAKRDRRLEGSAARVLLTRPLRWRVGPQLAYEGKALGMINGFHGDVHIQIRPMQMMRTLQLDVEQLPDGHVPEPGKMLERDKALLVSDKKPEAVL